MDEHKGDAFVGFTLRGIDESLKRIERRLAHVRERQEDLMRLSERIDRKIDAIGSTVPETLALIAEINEQTAKVVAASTAVDEVADNMRETGVDNAP